MAKTGRKKKIYLDEQRKLNERIDREISKHFDNDPTFLPDEYRRLRLSGISRIKIDYDMCHIFR